jgi:hypothetical protein
MELKVSRMMTRGCTLQSVDSLRCLSHQGYGVRVKPQLLGHQVKLQLVLRVAKPFHQKLNVLSAQKDTIEL